MKQRRRFDPEKIKIFFNGTGSNDRSNNDYYNNPDQQVPESTDSVPYDTDHEISPQSLEFGTYSSHLYYALCVVKRI